MKPSVIGIDHWPEVPKGQPWKEGVISALGITATPASFWKHVLGKVTSWKDLETPLLGAVEELIDFVAAGTLSRPESRPVHDRHLPCRHDAATEHRPHQL